MNLIILSKHISLSVFEKKANEYYKSCSRTEVLIQSYV